jgi:hypothetical protein
MTRERIEKLQQVAEGETILYTYDVIWKKRDMLWYARWDVPLGKSSRSSTSSLEFHLRLFGFCPCL